MWHNWYIRPTTHPYTHIPTHTHTCTHTQYILLVLKIDLLPVYATPPHIPDLCTQWPCTSCRSASYMYELCGGCHWMWQQLYVGVCVPMYVCQCVCAVWPVSVCAGNLLVWVRSCQFSQKFAWPLKIIFILSHMVEVLKICQNPNYWVSHLKHFQTMLLLFKR